MFPTISEITDESNDKNKRVIKANNGIIRLLVSHCLYKEGKFIYYSRI